MVRPSLDMAADGGEPAKQHQCIQLVEPEWGACTPSSWLNHGSAFTFLRPRPSGPVPCKDIVGAPGSIREHIRARHSIAPEQRLDGRTEGRQPVQSERTIQPETGACTRSWWRTVTV